MATYSLEIVRDRRRAGAYTVKRDRARVASLRGLDWIGRGRLEVDGEHYDLRTRGATRGVIELVRGETVLLRARRSLPSLGRWFLELPEDDSGVEWRLTQPSRPLPRFELRRDGAWAGRVSSWNSTPVKDGESERQRLRFDDSVPLPLAIFCGLVVRQLWRRQAALASAVAALFAVSQFT